MIISGQDVITEQPKEVTIQSEDVRSALVQPCEEMVVHIKETFKKNELISPPTSFRTASC